MQVDFAEEELKVIHNIVGKVIGDGRVRRITDSIHDKLAHIPRSRLNEYFTVGAGSALLVTVNRPAVEMTMAEVCAAIGKDIKIVKETNVS